MLFNLDKFEFRACGDYYQRPQSKCLIEQKIDGIRILLARELALTRGRNNWWPRLPQHIQAQAADTPVDGELNWPGHTSTDVPTALKNKETGLRFTAFYLPTLPSGPLEQRGRLRQMGFDVPELYGPEAYIEPPGLKVLEASATERKLEGWVLKEQMDPYWWRIKLKKTYDLIVTGYNIAETGRHTGKLKSLRCSAYINGILTEVANVSGMTDQIRYAVCHADIGRVVEVRSQFRAARGRLRHPRFIRWREDKISVESLVLSS
jgi:ATP-dependent DNA ligase